MIKTNKVKQMWELKQAVQPDTLDLYVYGEVEDVAIDYVNQCYIESENSAKHFREELGAHPDAKQINIFVNSLGGYVLEAMAIRNQLKRHPANVTGYVDGFAASAATFILTACDTVKMYSNTMQLPHNMWNISIGNAKDHRKSADDLDTLMVGNRKAYLEKTGGKLTEEKLMEILDKAEWLNAEQCLEYGFCDEIIAEEKDLTSAKQMLQKMNQTLEQQLSYSNFLMAQLRELSEPIEPVEKPDPVEPVETADPIETPKENKTLKFIQALNR